MKTITKLLFSFALPATLYCPSPCLGMTYSIKGSFSYQVFALQKEGESVRQKPLEREFELVSDGCGWKVRIVLVGNKDYDSFTYSYDGTNLLHYSTLAAGRGAADALQSVTVETSSVPATITSAAGEYVWLAFASGCYFKDRTNNRALSFDRLNSRTAVGRRHEVPCRFELSSLPPYLPAAVQYGDTNRDEVGYSSADFKSSGFTNMHGLRFPTSFEYRKYRRIPDAKATDGLSCILIVSGKVTSISTNRNAMDYPLPGERFMINDLRVPEFGVLYRTDDGVIPGTDTSIVETARGRARARNERQ